MAWRTPSPRWRSTKRSSARRCGRRPPCPDGASAAAACATHCARARRTRVPAHGTPRAPRTDPQEGAPGRVRRGQVLRVQEVGSGACPGAARAAAPGQFAARQGDVESAKINISVWDANALGRNVIIGATPPGLARAALRADGCGRAAQQARLSSMWPACTTASTTSSSSPCAVLRHALRRPPSLCCCALLSR